MSIDLDVKVRHADEDAPLHRFWVSLLERGRELVARRSVILHAGANEIVLHWNRLPHCFPTHAALYKQAEGGDVFCMSAIENAGQVPGCGATLTWILRI